MSPVQGIRNLYAGLSKSRATQNSTVILYNLINDSLNEQVDFVATTGSYPPFPFWTLPIAIVAPAFATPQKLSLKQAQDLALKALASAEERRQREREAEAKYWADLD
jgi:hypothetical protein